MFLAYYGLKEQPFGVTPDPRYLYFGDVHREALASLIYGVEANVGFATLIAQPGTGKTTLLYYLLNRFRSTAKTAFIFDTQCSSKELLRNMLMEFEVNASGDDTVALLTMAKEFLAAQARAGKRVLLVIDEAQNLEEPVLETVRLLSNFETQQGKLMHIILSGQPQLAHKLTRPSLANLRQRLTMVNRLKSFTPLEVMKYVAHRLNIAGYEGETLFTPEALNALVTYTKGVPREINRLCFNALSLGYAIDQKLIGEDIIREVAGDLDVQSLTKDRAMDASDVLSPTALSAVFSSALSTPLSIPFEPLAAPAGASFAAESGSDAIAAVTNVSDFYPQTTTEALGNGAAVAVRAASSAPVEIAKTESPRNSDRDLVATLAFDPSLLPEPESTNPFAQHWKAAVAVLVLVLAVTAGLFGTRRYLAASNSVTAETQPSMSTPAAEPVSNVGVENPVKRIARKARQNAIPALEVSGLSRIQRPPSAIPEPNIPDVAMSRAISPEAIASSGPSNSNVTLEQAPPAPDIQPAVAVKTFRPRYPNVARELRVEGDVVLSARINERGRVESVQVIQGPELLREPAKEAVSKWIYRPMLVNGEPKDSTAQVIVSFQDRH